jgi:hypothetical protein
MRPLGHKASFLALAAVVATAVMGAAHAMWFEDLRLTTNATTGTLDARIGCDPGDPEGPVIQVDDSNPPSLLLTVSGAEPDSVLTCALSIENTGTLAWHLESQEVSQTGDDSKPLLVTLDDLLGCQVHGGEKLETTLMLQVPAEVEPETEYQVTLTFGVIQWNTSAFEGCVEQQASADPARGMEGNGRT